MQKFLENGGIFKLFMILLCATKLHYVWAACGEKEWMCDDGSCIAGDRKCDGTVECVDGSDEIAENCIHLAHICHRFAFTCSYGACIAGLYSCNNITNCADNSDEFVCLNKNNPSHHQGQCGTNKMECLRSQECIDRDRMCDGARDCSDGTDETVEVCAGFPCPKVAFRCGYGGCVAGNGKCNGLIDCADGSDEAWQLCNTPRRPGFKTGATPGPPIAPTPGPPRVPPKEPPREPPTSSDPDDSEEGLGCQLPLDRPELIFKLHPNNKTIQASEGAVDTETVHIECLNGGRSFHLTSIVCENGIFNSPIPLCNNYCDKKLLEGTSTSYSVYSKGIPVNPDVLTKGIPPDSIVIISCRNGFMSRTAARQELFCDKNGKFDKERQSCQLDCGIPLTNKVTLTNNGVPTKPIELPWHASLYEYKSGVYIYFCSGSILSPSIVLSAAHCFPENINRLRIEPKRYMFMAGKYHRAYDYPNDGEPQARHAKNIHVWDQYEGSKRNYLQDIALIRLDTPFFFNENISAVCRPIIRGFGGDSVPDDFIGLIAGFDEISNELHSLNLTAISFNTCQRKSQDGSLATDKFCLSIVNDMSLCRGDSGGGYAEKFYDKYHLLGILSYTSSTKDECARNGYVAMTNARFMTPALKSTFDNWLKEDERLF